MSTASPVEFDPRLDGRITAESLHNIAKLDIDKAKPIKNAQELQAYAKEIGAEVLDLLFVDVPGALQHTSKPIHQLDDVLDGGAGFDGSSIRGFKQINESDMLLIPDATTAFRDPFISSKTVLSVLCDIRDPLSSEFFQSSPRTIAKAAEAHLKESGIADTAYFGPEAEFFIFDSVSYETGQNVSHYAVDSNEGAWNAGRKGLGYTIRNKEGYFPASPFDTQMDIRMEMVQEMERMGIKIETQHHEVATAGQAEIDMRFDTLLTMADKLMKYKYVVRNVARKHGKVATFMPKPLFGDNGSGMHVHQSLWKNNQPLFGGDKYAGLSQDALYYIGGLLKHARALAAICNPATNSYKRLVPGFEAPVNLIYSARNRSAAIRIPTYSQSPKAKRIEFRMPDPLANPYLAFSALLMAGLDGIKNKIDPGAHTDENLYEMDARRLAKIPHAPANLGEALDALEADHAFLLEGGVFKKEFLDAFVDQKRTEVSDEAKRPSPSEFCRYFDA